MDGKVYQGVTFPPYTTHGDGCVFTNCTFLAPNDFGKGCVFKDCNFERCCPPYYNNRWSKVGEAGVVDGGYWDYVTFGKDTTLKSGGGGSYSMEEGVTKDAGAKSRGRGIAVEGSGHIVTGESVLKMGDAICECEDQWDKEIYEKGFLGLDDESAKVTIEGASDGNIFH